MALMMMPVETFWKDDKRLIVNIVQLLMTSTDSGEAFRPLSDDPELRGAVFASSTSVSAVDERR